MAITVPVPATMVSVSTWGKPVTDEVNRITPIANGVNIVGYTTVNALTVPGGYTQANIVLNTGSGAALSSGITMASTGFTVLTSGIYEILGSLLCSGGAAGSDHSINAYKAGSTLVASATLISPSNSWVGGTLLAYVRLVANDVITFKAASGPGTSVDNRTTLGMKWVAS